MKKYYNLIFICSNKYLLQLKQYGEKNKYLENFDKKNLINNA